MLIVIGSCREPPSDLKIIVFFIYIYLPERWDSESDSNEFQWELECQWINDQQVRCAYPTKVCS